MQEDLELRAKILTRSGKAPEAAHQAGDCRVACNSKGQRRDLITIFRGPPSATQTKNQAQNLQGQKKPERLSSRGMRLAGWLLERRGRDRAPEKDHN